MSQEPREAGKQWIEGVLHALADADWIQLTQIEWKNPSDGHHELVVGTPQQTLTETFHGADLEKLPTDGRSTRKEHLICMR